MKNYRTPRQQSDAEFGVGYPTLPRHRHHAMTDLVWAIVCVAVCAFIGALLAWGV
jgi:hypothetical protein